MKRKNYNIKRNTPQLLLSVVFFFLSLGILDAQVYTTSGTYTVPAGVTSIRVHAWGAGGGGGYRTTNGGGGGGGGGGYSYRELTVTPGQTYTITIGTGGSGGSGTNAGGNTTVSIGATTYVRANGGAGAADNNTAGGAGGSTAGAVGSVILPGTAGTAAGAGTTGNGGNGGSSPNGGTGGAGATANNSAGTIGDAPGGGGGGARRTSNIGGNLNGGNGGAGRVVIETFTYSGSGSRDLYPFGAYGGRATLRASEAVATFFPFPIYGTHYVYAKVGETIAIAHSAQNSTDQRIYLYHPNGTPVTPTGANSPNATRGNIPNRAGELNGPQLLGQSIPGKYTPVYYTVPAGGEGIYRVEFR